jgi:thiamine-phosphate pyrophosphorylase
MPASPFGIYVIIDAPDPSGLSPADIAAAAARGGARFLQLRAKAADTATRISWLREMVTAVARRAAIVVNDDVDATFAVPGVWGLHLGREDLDALQFRGGTTGLRERLSAHALGLGLSTHGVEHVDDALRHLPDYLAFGPIKATSTKRDTWPVVGPARLAEATRAFPHVPFVAIGGLGEGDAAALVEAGASAMAVIGAARGSTLDEIEARTRALCEAWRRAC